MKRRDFLKGIAAITAISFIPKLTNKLFPKKGRVLYVGANNSTHSIAHKKGTINNPYQTLGDVLVDANSGDTIFIMPGYVNV